jgi:hypothetical protein
MKLIGRILILLASALVVVGATVAIVNATGTSQSTFRPDGRRFAFSGDGAFTSRQRPEGFADGQHGSETDRFGGGSMILGLGKNLVIISVIVAIIIMAERLLAKIRRPKVASVVTNNQSRQ